MIHNEIIHARHLDGTCCGVDGVKTGDYDRVTCGSCLDGLSEEAHEQMLARGY